jgi:diguanylate cyclase (GGDEF)-like protein
MTILIGVLCSSVMVFILSRIFFDEKDLHSLLIILPFIILTSVIVCLVSLRFLFVNPVRRLTDESKNISENDWKFISPVTSDDEIGVLGNIIESMSRKLREVLSSHDKNIKRLDSVNQSLSKMNSIVDNSQDLTAVLSPDWEITYANKNFLNTFGENAIDSNFDDCYRDKFPDEFEPLTKIITEKLATESLWESEVKSADNVVPICELFQTVYKYIDESGDFVSYIYSAQNTFQGSEHNEKMAWLAYYDHLTGLQNRTYFKNQLEKELLSVKREDSLIALLYLDLDNFKMINDSMGHEAGDQLLITAAERLTKCLREEDSIARLGGDEFAIILTGIDAVHYASIVANKIIRALNQPVYIDGQGLSIKASLGITIAPQDGMGSAELMKNADVAMYEAKQKGKNSFRFFTPDMDRNVANRVQKEHEIQSAFENQEFILYYQPKVNVRTGEVDSAEALVRWQSPDGKIRAPVEFIDIIENGDLIIPFGLWVIRSGCQQAKTLYKSLRRRILISVNVSPRQLMAPGFVSSVENVIKEVGVDPSLIELEITESLFMDNLSQTIEHLSALRALGLRISVDDFGTGFSSLSYLKRLPIDQLKIDRSFIMDIPGDEEDCVITELIITMAQRLSLEVVAEGVETKEQFQYLQGMDCDLIQGYLFSKPLPPDEFMVYVFNGVQKSIFNQNCSG